MDKMTPEVVPIEEFFNHLSDEVFLNAGFQIDWAVKGIGFGGFYFHQDENGIIRISNECMSKDFIKKVLCMMVDKAILQDER